MKWTKKDQLLSICEGWVLTNNSDWKVCIAKIDDPQAWIDDGWPLSYNKPRFKWDEGAVRFVKKLARKNTPHAVKALKMAGMNFYPKKRKK